MMTERLKELTNIPGVKSVFAVNNRGEMISDHLNGNMDQAVAEELGARIVKIFAIGMYGKVERKTSEIELLFDKSRFLAIDCGYYNMIISCDNSVPISMLRMTVNVLVKTIAADKKVEKFLEGHRIDKKILLRKEKLSEEELKLIEKI